MTTNEFLQVHTHEFKPYPAPDEAITETPPILDHDFKEDEQWGDISEMESSFDEVGYYEHCIIVQHLVYSQRQDGNLFDGIFDQCIFDAQTSEPLQEIVFYEADETEIGLPPEDSLKVPTPSRPQTLTKRTPDDDNLCARMSGGEIPINNGILKDKLTIDKSKLAGTPNAVGTGNSICGVDLEHPHPPDGTFRDKSTNGINTGMLTKETKPTPPPEPTPTIFNIHQKLNNNGLIYKDPLIFNFKCKGIKWKFQWSYCNVLVEWKMGRSPKNP
jgi:hypothetical protein